MKLAWQVSLTDRGNGGTMMTGYGDTHGTALADLYAKIDARATEAQESAARVTSAMVKVRGELEGLTDGS